MLATQGFSCEYLSSRETLRQKCRVISRQMGSPFKVRSTGDSVPDLIANVAVIGRMQLLPGILPVRLESPNVECLVAHAFPNHIEELKRGIKVDTSDCTVFTVTHRERGDLD